MRAGAPTSLRFGADPRGGGARSTMALFYLFLPQQRNERKKVLAAPLSTLTTHTSTPS